MFILSQKVKNASLDNLFICKLSNLIQSITHLPIFSQDNINNNVLMFTVNAFCCVYVKTVYKIVARFFENQAPEQLITTLNFQTATVMPSYYPSFTGHQIVSLSAVLCVN